jgi:hypothetical protein
MARSRRGQSSWMRQIALLIFIPVVLMGASYALFSQQLSIAANTSSVAYVSSNYTTFTYTKSSTLAGSTYTYSINPFTITNQGATSITAWSVKVTLPADTPSVSCPSTIVCSFNTTTDVLTITNGTTNGTIAAGGSTTINNTTTPVRFTSTTGAYTLQNVQISATFSTAFQTINGLTVTINRGSSSKKGNTYTWMPDITVTNNSGQSISGWQVIVSPWSTSYSVTSTMPSGVSYATSASQLTFTSTNALADGASYNLTPTITTNTATWNPTVTVQGKA